jgi:hypothetical protein
MASTLKIGAKLASNSRLKKLGVAAGLMAAVGYGAAREDPVQYTMNAAQETLFGTDQIDNMALGTDLTARNFVGIPFGMEPTAGKGVGAGALLGGGVGAVLGRGKLGKMVGAGIGAGIGGLVGGAAGFANSDIGRVLRPRDNPANMFSGRSLNQTAFEYRKVDTTQSENILQSAADYPFFEEGDGIRGYSQYQNSTFPQRMTNRTWDSATGDIVLGSYNLRRG